LNRVFSPRFNPMYYLGALAFLFIWMVFISGFYLLFFYHIGVEWAYDSLNSLNRFNKVFRSIHRYASDGAMIALVLHLLREYFNDRYRNWRWVAWVTGVAILIVFWVLGVTGYWMVWDQRSQMIARMSAEFLDFLPIFGQPLTRAFLSNDAVTNILFIGVIFLHLSIPTIILFLLWIHVVRISRPVINPPKELITALTVITLVSCILYPAASVGRADLSIVAARFGIDWWFLFLFPLLAALPVWASWLVTVVGAGVLTFLPWSIRSGKQATAEVILPNCVGCELCFKDCPYEAIYMRKRTDNLPYKEEAVVAPKRCASCGLCVGSCDYHAIDLPDMTEEMIYKEITSLMASDAKGEPKILNVACGYGVGMRGLINPETRTLRDMANVKVLMLPCVAMLQPAMIEHALKAGAEGVFISGCRERDCHFREGNQFIEGRLLNTRPPILKKHKDIDPSRIRSGWFSSVQAEGYFNDLRDFSNDLKGNKKEIKLSTHRYVRERLTVAGIVLLAIPAVLTLILSDAPYTFFNHTDSLLRFSFRHSGSHIKEAAMPTEEDLKKMLPHMRARLPKAGPRLPVYAEVEIDGQRVVASSYRPGGLKSDGSSYAYEKVVVTPGIHKVTIRMSDINSSEKFDYLYDQDIEFKAGSQICIDFSEGKKGFYIRK
ncbi:MAG: cytochrome b N-terminal domain-containing protein, partial [Deltaproteobacteria bacterium]